MIVSAAPALVALGVVIGIAAFFALARLLGSFLYGVGAGDPLAMAAATAVLLVVGVLAARHAGRAREPHGSRHRAARAMSTDNSLGVFEEQVMLAVLHARDDAYGMNVRREIETRTGREVAIGAVYATLDRLEAKGLIAFDACCRRRRLSSRVHGDRAAATRRSSRRGRA